MNDDDKVGDFSYQLSGIGIDDNGVGGQIHSSNWEGSGGPYGKVYGTLKLHVAAGETAGRAEFFTSTYLDSGVLTTATGTGTWSAEGNHVWRVRMINLLSDGSIFGGDGIVDLERREFLGSFYDWR